MTRRVFICSPFGGKAENVELARKLCTLALHAGFAPFAPHLFYPQLLDESNPKDRQIGIECGAVWVQVCEEFWILDVELTAGMVVELEIAKTLGKPIIWMPDINNTELDEDVRKFRIEQSTRKTIKHT